MAALIQVISLLLFNIENIYIYKLQLFSFQVTLTS